MSEENKVSNETVVEQDTENVTQDNAQNEYIAESKKYRRRAQDAESQLSKLQKQIEAQENKKLEDERQFQELANKYKSERDEFSPYKEKYESMVEQRKNSLLSRLPEDQHDKFKNKDIDVLEFMVDQLKTKAPEPSARNLVGTKGTEYGGYESIEEYAVKDPKGAEKYLRENVKGFSFGRKNR
jgi:seryl-tRNA synthetase